MNCLKYWKEKTPISNPNLTKVSFKNKKNINTNSEKQNLREFVYIRAALPEMLEEILQKEGKLYRSDTKIYINKVRVLEKE